MVRDFDSAAPKGTDKVVACITAQYNSERLIDTAAEVADKFNAELHILHVNKGTSIFNCLNTEVKKAEWFICCAAMTSLNPLEIL